MRILIVAATSLEIAPLTARLRSRVARPSTSSGRANASQHDQQNTLILSLSTHERLTSYGYWTHDIDVLVTGVGMVATATWTARVLAETGYDLALNLGICGSFNQDFPLGGAVHVGTDCIAELGAEDDDRFLSIEELGLTAEHTFVNMAIPENAALRRLPLVNGITVNTVHGRTESIAAVVRRFNPDVESMEGAGFMHACQIHGVAFAQVRAVANIVEKRNRDAWALDEAIAGLSCAALEILDNA